MAKHVIDSDLNKLIGDLNRIDFTQDKDIVSLILYLKSKIIELEEKLNTSISENDEMDFLETLKKLNSN